MAAQDYSYLVGVIVNQQTLLVEISAASLPSPTRMLFQSNGSPTNLTITFDPPLNGPDEATLDAVVADHTGGLPATPSLVGNNFISNGRLSFVDNGIVSIGTAGKVSIASAINENFEIAWEGTLAADISLQGAGGLDSNDVEAADTWYAVHVIGDTSENYPVAAMLSSSPSAPTLPPGYNVFRRMGWVRNDSNSDFLKFFQAGSSQDRHYEYDVPVASLQVLASGNAIVPTPVDLSALAPPGASRCSLRATVVVAIITRSASIRPTGATSATPPIRILPGITASTTAFVQLNLAGSESVDYSMENAADTLDLDLLGFDDEI